MHKNAKYMEGVEYTEADMSETQQKLKKQTKHDQSGRMSRDTKEREGNTYNRTHWTKQRAKAGR